MARVRSSLSLAKLYLPFSAALGVTQSMFKSAEYGFIAILLSLCMYYAFVAFQEDEAGIELVFLHGLIAYPECNQHTLLLKLDNDNIYFEGNIVNQSFILKHFVAHHQEQCELKTVYIEATENTLNNNVIALSSVIKQVLPSVDIAWVIQDSKQK
ncbi:hypothetical protein N7931_19035 [Catenovulum sp. 2E275]|uniref:hypothetical protein n=1 Tax=Catenovulum sp. 2E275 TaxID=2980497 RepID=UPI0021CFC596|nr:hypothetical protein [Catenovulum sp. 2E275]MCU4677708.1 hypothetical protein [Catenovulum sp. 2E275]